MRYSKRAESVIRFANQEAARLDHDHISTGHLLLGSIREGGGAAITFLKDINVDLEKMKAELESVMESKGRGSVIGHGVVPITQCLGVMKNAGFDGVLSIEFEGIEEPLNGIRIGVANLRRFVEAIYG